MEYQYYSGFLLVKDNNKNKWNKKHIRWNGNTLTYYDKAQMNSECRLKIDRNEIIRIIYGINDDKHNKFWMHLWLKGFEESQFNKDLVVEMKMDTRELQRFWLNLLDGVAVQGALQTEGVCSVDGDVWLWTDTTDAKKTTGSKEIKEAIHFVRGTPVDRLLVENNKKQMRTLIPLNNPLD